MDTLERSAIAAGMGKNTSEMRTPLQNYGLAGGVLALALTLILPVDMEPAAWRAAGVTMLMAIWWATEALPLSATALAPLVLLTPLGVSPFAKVTAPYANETIFLILGGFLLGVAMQRWDLHKRIAYTIVLKAGAHPRALVLGVMMATAFISMWTSNTSTTLMMLPVALSIAAVLAPPGEELSRDQRSFATAIIVSVAYSATIGGLGTLIGSPTNTLVAGFMRQNFGVDVSFADWLVFGLPTVALLLPGTWFLLTRVSFRFELGSGESAHAAVREELRALGPLSPAERRVWWCSCSRPRRGSRAGCSMKRVCSSIRSSPASATRPSRSSRGSCSSCCLRAAVGARCSSART